MWTDPIVDEVRRARQSYAAKLNYDLWAIYRDLKEKEMDHADKLVAPPEERPRRRKRPAAAPASGRSR